jgi:hypothetical protein
VGFLLIPLPTPLNQIKGILINKHRRILMLESKYKKMDCSNTEWISLEEVFPNPTEEQINIWNKSYGGEKDDETICQGIYYDILIDTLQDRIIEHLEEEEVQ